MALFTRADLQRTAAFRKSLGFTKTASAKLLDEARKFDPSTLYDVFLSHASLDADEIWELREDIQQLGYTVYVDWIDDPQLDRSRVTRKTAALLKERMHACRSLLFATTPHSQRSVWMPWELGYFDGMGRHVAVLPILEEEPAIEDAYVGREYLALYPYVSLNDTARSTPARPRKELFINLAPDNYVSMKSWLDGSEPTPRSNPPLVLSGTPRLRRRS